MDSKAVNRFDIYWVNLDPTIGSEIQKTRPCIIVSPNEMNKTLKTIIVAPLTSTIIDWPFRTTVTVSSKKSSVACDQIRTISKERLLGRIGSISSKEKTAILDILQSIMTE
jgi:mRNA interferase MazF